ncbi:MAG TPA: T9SS type A sorting domain-containing protein [Bacteroidia bacterium]
MMFVKRIVYLLAIPVLFTACSGLGLFSKKTIKKTKNEAYPGYFDQWLYIKTGGTKVMPDLSQYNWDIQSRKRSNSNALLNVYEYGPDNVAGRLRALVVDYSNPNHLILGGASGGVFVSNDNGASWRAINDQALSPSVTYMDQNPFNPQVIYYCTGEFAGNSADLTGKGVFKSTDGGNSFTQLKATNNSFFQMNWSVKCSPKDTNTLYVATNSSGLWKSVNGGDSFYRVYNTAVQMNDLEVFPNGSVMFTLKGTGVFRSDNGENATFTKVSSISSNQTARGELAYCKDFPNVVYAAISRPDSSYNGVLQKFYKSSDGGKTFVGKSNPDPVVNFGFTWYCLTMNVKNNDSNSIFIASVTSGYSKDGGNSWDAAEDQHSDHHIAVTSGNNLYVGSDGGLCIYDWNGSFTNFTNLNNRLNITQIYNGAVSPHNQNLLIGCQDNGTKESRSFNPAFTTIYGADGGYCFYHASKSNSRYYSYQNGVVIRNGNFISGNIPGSDSRWFIHPYAVSQSKGEYVLYPSYTNLYFSSNEGNSFKKIGNITTGNLFAASFSEGDNPAVYSGGSSSLIAIDSVLKTTVSVVNLRGLSPNYMRGSFVNCVKVIPGYRDRIYVAYSNISDSGRLWKISNVFGTPVFKNIGRGLPMGLPVNWVECDPLDPERVIFAGTDYGLYVSEDSGTTWLKDTRIPSTVVSCIQVFKNNKDIYFFTHGRGVFKGQINNSAFSSIDQIGNDAMKSAYPVPANDKLTIEFAKEFKGTYSVIDSQGKELVNGQINGLNLELNTSEFSNGAYVLVYREGNVSGTVKFTVTH